MKNLNMDQLRRVVIAVLMAVVGILFCCSLAIGINGLSVIIGLILIITGVLFAINAMLTSGGMLTSQGIVGGVLLSLGIVFIAHKLAGIIFIYIPWLLIVLGATIVLDALLAKFVKEESGYTNLIIKLVVGIVALVLGLCLRLIDGFMEYAAIMLGILLIVYALLMLFTIFSNKQLKN